MIIMVLCTVSYQIAAQSDFGFELKWNTCLTKNSGLLLGGSWGLGGYAINGEDDPITHGYSLGIVYNLNERNLVKLHFGKHQNGRILDLTVYDDVGSSYSYTAVDEPYNYFQIAPSYMYRILNNKVIIPVELGVNINMTINEKDIFFVDINKFNFDIEMSTGVDYVLFPDFIIGLHGVYTRYLNEYQDKETVSGSYKPVQFGLECSLLFEW